MNNKRCLVIVIWLLFIPLKVFAQPATVLSFSEQQKGSAEEIITMTVTDNYLRIDDRPVKASEANADENKGFILYDRKKNEIFSVSYDTQQIIKIKKVAVTIPSPIELHIKTVFQPEDKQAPLIGGKKTQRQSIYVNEKLCMNVISVPGFLPDVVKVLKDFNQVLAGQQAETLDSIPADLHEACDLARHSFYPQYHLNNGFPMVVQSIDESGQANDLKRNRILMNFKQQQVSDKIFILPEFDIFSIN